MREEKDIKNGIGKQISKVRTIQRKKMPFETDNGNGRKTFLFLWSLS